MFSIGDKIIITKDCTATVRQRGATTKGWPTGQMMSIKKVFTALLFGL